MQRQKVVPSVITYSALISAYEESKSPEWPLHVFETIHRQRVVPDVITHSALINACKKGQRPEQVLKVFEAMKRQGLLLDIISMESLILAYPASCQSWRALAFFIGSVAIGLDFDMQVYSILLLECEQRGMFFTEVAVLSSLGKAYSSIAFCTAQVKLG